MPQQRMDIRMIKDILRLKYSAGLSHEAISRSLGISKGVVAKYLGLAGAAGLDWTTVAELDEAGLERRLLGRSTAETAVVEADFARVHVELRRKGVTLMLLWQEYRVAHEGRRTWAYTQFCEHYKAFAKTLKRSMRQHRRSGEKLFIDYAGSTLALADGSRAQVFVAAMGASSYTFACATADQTMRSWLGAMARALSFYGGVPQLIVLDNPRSLVSDACRYEPKLNDTVRDFARHYAVSILPARPYSPKDKATAESAVQVVTRWILARLRHTVLADVHAADAAISALLASLNNRPFLQARRQPRQPLRRTGQPGLDAAAATALAVGKLQDRQGPHRLPRRDRTPPLQRAAFLGGAGAGGTHHRRAGGSAAPGPARGLPRPQQPPRGLNHSGRAHARSPPGAQAVDARSADPLGCGHRPEHGSVRGPVAAALQAPRARLPQLPGPAQPGQALRPGAAGGGLHVGAGTARRALPPRARHPGQRT